MKARYLVLDPDEYEAFATFDEALQCAKTDIGEDGWVPCKSLVIVRVEAKVTETKTAPTVKDYRSGSK